MRDLPLVPVVFAYCLLFNNIICCSARTSLRTSLASGRTRLIYSTIRGGGGGYYEPNPNYVPKPKSPATNFDAYSSVYNTHPSTVGDIEKSVGKLTVSLPPGVDAAQRYVRTLHASNLPLSITAWVSVLVFCLWQLCYLPYPLFHRQLLLFLQRYFVCSRGNLQKFWYLPSVALSAMSHMNFVHLAINLLVFLRFGPQIFTAFNLNTNRQKILLLLGSAISGSLGYLVFDTNGVGCMGLSSVTFTFIALYAKRYPQRVLRLLFAGIIPVRMTAQQMLFGALLWSMLGTLMNYLPARPSSNIAHSAHLGGLIYGLVYYRLRYFFLK
jgi:membrane associated rhomboid family serine protease